MKKVYIITGIDCANCAAKIEQKFAKVPGVEEVSITFATEQLRLTAADPDALIPALLKIARDSEPDTQITPRDAKRPAAHSHAEHEHHHHHCDCGCEDEEEHEHHHHHHDDDDEHAHHHHHCDCGCEDEDEHHEHHHHAASGKGVKKVYKITGIDCANCAAKIERNINNIPGVEDATITFATEQLRLTAEDPDALIPAILAVARDEEPEAEITPLESKPQPAAEEKKKDTDLIAILAGTGLFVVGLFLKWLNLTIPADIAFVAGYLVLGLPVLKAAGGNLLKGHMLDENFLMSIATLGAFAMGSFTEAIGVMLFYRIGEYFEEKAVARSRSQIMEAVDLRPEVVTLEKGAVIPAGEAQVGDVLRILPGDRIPLDGVISDRREPPGHRPHYRRTGARSCGRGRQRHLRLREYLRQSDHAGGEASVRVHGHENSGQRGKRCGQQAEDRPVHHPVLPYLYPRCGGSFPGGCRDPAAFRPSVAPVDLHGPVLPGHELPLRSGPQRAAGLLLRHRRRQQAGHPLQGRREHRSHGGGEGRGHG